MNVMVKPMNAWSLRRFVCLVLVGGCVFASLLPSLALAQDTVAFLSATVRIQGRDGSVHTFRAELATTPTQQRRGLMFRKTLAADAAMLFVFNPPRRIAMWMKNTYIPLDMLFAAADGRIGFIAENTVPRSLTHIAPPLKTAFVLEVPAGTVKRLALRSGDVLHNKN